MYYAYITTLKGLRKHNNADRLQCVSVFGNNVITDLSYHDGDRVIYFPVDGQLGEEFAIENNLLRKKDESGNNIGGYLDPNKRNIVALKLRGEKSDGLVLPINVLEKYTNIDELKDGERISVLNGYEICKKYIPRTNPRSQRSSSGNKTRKHKEPIAPLFIEHADTEQLAYNMNAFNYGDLVEITLKMHGTSQRTAYLPVFKGYKRSLKDKILRKPGKPIYDWGYISGTRRTALEDYDGGYYGSNHFREQHSKFFEGKLYKGEEVFYEVVGFTDNGTPIMPSVSNKKIGDKEFEKQYGETTVFSYGCDPKGEVTKYNEDDNGYFEIKEKVPQSDFYVYRMTMTNEDGDIVEYPPSFMRYRCEQMGCKSVPVLWHGYLNKSDNSTEDKFDAGEAVKQIAEEYYDGPDPVGKSHVREGVVIRILNKPKFTAYKHKNFSFKLLSGIAVNNVNDTIADADILSEI